MDQRIANPNAGKFLDPTVTADGSLRATVALSNPQTLWFNTGTLCNITCVNCYIESSPTNDRLIYITAGEVEGGYLDQLDERKWRVDEIGFTGGEPFMNPEVIAMLRASLSRDYKVLVLTNAMRPMQRKSVREGGLLSLREAYGDQLTLRVSLDHWNPPAKHDEIRGQGSFGKTLQGMIWLRDNGFRMAIAGRALWGGRTRRRRGRNMPISSPDMTSRSTRKTLA